MGALVGGCEFGGRGEQVAVVVWVGWGGVEEDLAMHISPSPTHWRAWAPITATPPPPPPPPPPTPTGAWFERRLNYSRSVAVNSMAGYVIGLGDRHSQNILLDRTTAEVVHIDLGIAFEQVGPCLWAGGAGL